MPDETRAIEPALTNDEWRQRKRPQYYREQPCIRWLRDGRLLISEDEMRDGEIVEGASEIVQVRDADSLFALMALANAALPDGDPRKITREDVNELLEIAKDDDHPATIHDDQLKQIAAKLTALLPPEE